MTFDVLDVDSWYVMSEEAGGANPKNWLAREPDVDSDQYWLWKPARRHVPNSLGNFPSQWTDDHSERVVCELARLIGLPSADIQFGQLGGDRGTLSRTVIPEGWSRVEGDALLDGIPGYVPISAQEEIKPGKRTRTGYTLENILTVLDGAAGPIGSDYVTWSAGEVFAGYLVLDAWVANTDRHARNWFVVEQWERSHLGATFDHGSALGAGMHPQARRRASASIGPWCAKGCARPFEQSPSLVDLAHTAVAATGPRSEVWLDRLATVQAGQWRDLLQRVDGMSEEAYTFSCMLLDTNRERLLL